jgi:putative aminopeptidase FrvX
MQPHDSLFSLIGDLVMRHSPSGVEHEIDELLSSRFAELGLDARLDPSGNVVVKIAGTGGGGCIAITAHKDEIGMIVTAVQEGGRIRVRRLGGSFPWVYGEGIVDLLGDHHHISGILSFGSRHVSHASPQHVHRETAPLLWSSAWIETKLSAAELAEAGVRAGTRAVIGKHRKMPYRLKDYIASYTLDNKASVAILLELGRIIDRPRPDVYLVATAKEEVGSTGALYFAQRQQLDALIALEIAPLAPEYAVADDTAPVLLAEDGIGLYDDTLNGVIQRAAAGRQIPLQVAVMSNFGSDGSVAMKAGHVPKAACLGFPTQNTHGYEIAHLGAIQKCIDIVDAACQESFI